MYKNGRIRAHKEGFSVWERVERRKCKAKKKEKGPAQHSFSLLARTTLLDLSTFRHWIHSTYIHKSIYIYYRLEQLERTTTTLLLAPPSTITTFSFPLFLATREAINRCGRSICASTSISSVPRHRVINY